MTQPDTQLDTLFSFQNLSVRTRFYAEHAATLNGIMRDHLIDGDSAACASISDLFAVRVLPNGVKLTGSFPEGRCTVCYMVPADAQVTGADGYQLSQAEKIQVLRWIDAGQTGPQIAVHFKIPFKSLAVQMRTSTVQEK